MGSGSWTSHDWDGYSRSSISKDRFVVVWADKPSHIFTTTRSYILYQYSTIV